MGERLERFTYPSEPGAPPIFQICHKVCTRDPRGEEDRRTNIETVTDEEFQRRLPKAGLVERDEQLVYTWKLTDPQGKEFDYGIPEKVFTQQLPASHLIVTAGHRGLVDYLAKDRNVTTYVIGLKADDSALTSRLKYRIEQSGGVWDPETEAMARESIEAGQREFRTLLREGFFHQTIDTPDRCVWDTLYDVLRVISDELNGGLLTVSKKTDLEHELRGYSLETRDGSVVRVKYNPRDISPTPWYELTATQTSHPT